MSELFALSRSVYLGALFASLPLSTHAQAPLSTAFVGVNVVPMDRDTVLEGQTVIVTHGRVVALGPVGKVPIPAKAAIVEGAGKYLIPGLADMHVHIAYPDLDTIPVPDVLFALLANGITTVRDMHSGSRGGRTNGQWRLGLRQRLAAGTALGPRLLTAGDPDYSSPEAAAKSVAALKADGHDFVKISMDGGSRALYDSIVIPARRAGLRVVGHVPPHIGVEQVIADRWASTEHLYEYLEYIVGVGGRWSITDGGLAFFPALPLADTAAWMRPEYRADSAKLRRLADAAREANLWNSPTIYILEWLQAGLASGAEKMPNDSASGNKWVGGRMDVRARARVLARNLEINRQMIRALRDAGAGLLLGSDMGFGASAGFSIHQELAALVRAGLTPFQALASGTRDVATFLGTTDSTGTIAVGKRADLVLLYGNPLADIGYTAGPAGVMIGGRWISRAEIDARLAAFPTDGGQKRLYRELKEARAMVWRH